MVISEKNSMMWKIELCLYIVCFIGQKRQTGFVGGALEQTVEWDPRMQQAFLFGVAAHLYGCPQPTLNEIWDLRSFWNLFYYHWLVLCSGKGRLSLSFPLLLSLSRWNCPDFPTHFGNGKNCHEYDKFHFERSSFVQIDYRKEVLERGMPQGAL